MIVATAVLLTCHETSYRNVPEGATYLKLHDPFVTARIRHVMNSSNGVPLVPATRKAEFIGIDIADQLSVVHDLVFQENEQQVKLYGV